MIGKILMGIMSLIISLVNVLLAPIDALIASALPDLSAGLTAVNSMLDYAATYFTYLVDMTLLGQTAINLIIAYYTFVLTLPLGVATVKLAIKWYDKLKP